MCLLTWLLYQNIFCFTPLTKIDPLLTKLQHPPLGALAVPERYRNREGAVCVGLACPRGAKIVLKCLSAIFFELFYEEGEGEKKAP